MLHTNFLFRSIFWGGGRQKFTAHRRQNPKSASAIGALAQTVHEVVYSQRRERNRRSRSSARSKIRVSFASLSARRGCGNLFRARNV